MATSGVIMSQRRTGLLRKLRSTGAAAWLIAACGCSVPPKEVSGVIYDAGTGKPLAGVYVMAVYTEGGSSGGHSATWCTATRAMTTESDGRYRFPVGRPNSPYIMPLALDRVEDQPKRPFKIVPTLTGTRRIYTGDYIFMDRALGRPTTGELFLCERPQNRADLDSNRAYLQMMLAINAKYPAWYVHDHIVGMLAILDNKASAIPSNANVKAADER